MTQSILLLTQQLITRIHTIKPKQGFNQDCTHFRMPSGRQGERCGIYMQRGLEFNTKNALNITDVIKLNVENGIVVASISSHSSDSNSPDAIYQPSIRWMLALDWAVVRILSPWIHVNLVLCNDITCWYNASLKRAAKELSRSGVAAGEYLLAPAS